MELEMADLQSKKPAPAGPIATPAPVEAPPVTATGAEQPKNPQVTAPVPSATPATAVEGPHSEIHNQPAAAANPGNAAPGTQPGASATPAALPQSRTQVPPASPSSHPLQKPPGTPIPVRGAPTPKPTP